MKLDIVGRRYLYFWISLLLIVPGLIGLILWGLPLAIDFTGGGYAELRFESGEVPPLNEIRALYAEFEVEDAAPRTGGPGELLVRSGQLTGEGNDLIVAALNERYGEVTLLRFDSVGPTIGREVTNRAVWAIAAASLGIMFYIWYAFRGVPNAHRYGVGAILAMLHDLAVVFGMQAILSRFFGWEVDALFLTALLTVASFSVHDSIVVFDRIRENAGKARRRTPYEEIVNDSIVQTITRSLNTQITVFLTLLALVIFGGDTLRHFVIILMIGVLSGTYSSIFNAAPILVVWENREWETWFRRKPATR
ncbi:MAG: protein translocase subunit SecF [Anaerolineae bacterium]|nr:MAG: protein translocase subunit SecF [Anaerolineae bacterium]